MHTNDVSNGLYLTSPLHSLYLEKNGFECMRTGDPHPPAYGASVYSGDG